MFNANFYIFAKKPNSTKVPQAGDAVQMQIELKDDSDILNLVIKVSGATGITTPYNFNYCYIPAFNRYYFIQSWAYTLGLWECSLTVDVLASYKAAIITSSQYVLRSASAYNGQIVDTLYPIMDHITMAHTNVNLSPIRNMTFSLRRGYYVLGVISEGSSQGAVQYYILNAAQMDDLNEALFSNIQLYGVTDISESFLKTLFNPYDYIVSCKWFPLTDLLAVIGTEEFPDLVIGWWAFTGTPVNVLTSNSLSVVTRTWYLPVSSFGNHPQASVRGKYLNYAPYTEYTFDIAPYGSINLPPEAAEYGCHCAEIIDLVTGDGILKIYIGGSDTTRTAVPIMTVESQIAVDIQLAQVRPSGGIQGAGVNLLSQGLGGLVNTVAPDGPIKSALSGITGAVTAQNTTVRTSGNNGGLAQLAQFGEFNGYLTRKYRMITPEDNTHLGRPLCETRSLSTLSGYTLCSSADIATTGTEAENKQIIDYLNTGFYLE